METTKDVLLRHISEDRLIEMTSEMIRRPSYAGVSMQETAVATYIRSVFASHSIPCELTEVEDGRCNVTAWLEGEMPGKTILFNGHTDTVEPNGMQDAFQPKVVDGRLYGRGSSDMKGPLAAMMESMIALKQSNLFRKGKVFFTGVLDEEHVSIGTIDLLKRGLKADGAIIGEPTALQICTAHRGLEWLHFHFTGKTVHGGAQREGVNAILKAVKFINAMEDTLAPAVFARKHPLLEEATLNYGVIHGGTQLSTVAGTCDLYVDRRFLPYESYEQVLKEFTQILDALAAEDPTFHCEMKIAKECKMQDGYVHLPIEIPVDHPLVTDLQASVRTVLQDEPVMTFFPAWTDGGLLSNYAGIPCVVLGPGIISCCHANDEYVPVDHLPKAALIYALTALAFCGSDPSV